MGIVSRVLKKRGLTEENIKKERMKRFSWPEMEKVAQIVIEDLILSAEEELVGVLYDVDADGLFAGYTLEDYFTRKRLTVKRYMNKKKKHGVLAADVRKYIEDGIKWLFVVDAGSGDGESILQLTNAGIRVVVLDHHLYEETTELDDKNSWILNVVDKPELPKLSGCGVVYRFIETMAEPFDDMVGQYEKYVGITVLSDSCDMSDPENRYYVQRAYEEYRGNYFLQQFPFYGSWRSFYSYAVIPYLNACIRVGEEEHVMDLINNMNNRAKMNKIPRDIQRVKTKQTKMIEEIYAISKEIKKEGITFLLRREGEELRPVGGLAANQLINKYGQPAMVLQRKGKVWEGSFRSNSYTKKILEDANLRAQGHDHACGIQVENKVLQEFVKTFKKEGLLTVNRPEFRAGIGGISKKVWMEIAQFNEFSGTNMERVLVKLKERYGEQEHIEEIGEKKRFIVFKQGEVIDFTGNVKDKEIIVEPVLKDLESQLIRI